MVGMGTLGHGDRLYQAGEFALAAAAVARLKAMGEALNDPRLQSYAAWSAGLIHTLTGDWETGIQVCQRAVERARDPVSAAISLSELGLAYRESGDAAQALRVLEQALQQLQRMRSRQQLCVVTAWVSEALLVNGRLDEARDLALQGLESSQDIKHRSGVGMAQRVLGRIAQASGEFAEAESYLHQALQTFASLQMRFEVARTHVDLAMLAHARATRRPS